MKSILLITSLLVAASTDAAIFYVNIFDVDAADETPGDGICKVAAGNACTLRAAVMEANALAGIDIIILPGNETIFLTLNGADENSAVTGDLDITEGVTIGTFVEPIDEFPTVTALNIDDRVFDVQFGVSPVTFANFKIVNGNASSDSLRGGAIHTNQFSEVDVISIWFQDNIAESGGAISVAVNSELSVTGSVFRGNAVTGNGAAISSWGDTFISQSTFFEHVNLNMSQQEVLYVTDTIPFGTGLLTVNNSTLFNNNGSAIYSDGGQVFLNNSTLVDNDKFGLVANPGDFDTTASIRNTVFNNNGISDCSIAGLVTTAITNAYNASSDISCLAGGNTNLIGSPGLSEVQTDAYDWHRYFRPKFNSPLKDSAHPSTPGLPSACEAEDQLELNRATDGGDRCDRGAIELSSDIIFFDGF